MHCIAIDCMGGDDAPAVIVAGAIAGSLKYNVKVLLIGDEPQIVAALAQIPEAETAHYEIIPTTEVITNNEAPVLAVRRKKNSSLVVAAKLVQDQTAKAMITAGSTGAFLAAGLFTVGRLPQVRRPALAPVLPTLTASSTLLLDVGANMDATAEDLLQYAIMGKIYAENLLGRHNPRIALLNVGTESKKGNALTKDAYKLLEAADLNFAGNIEARTLLQGEVDVVVCDGFAGNITLKTMEGISSVLFGLLKQQIKASIKSQIGGLLLKSSLLEIREMLDYNAHGAAPLLGLKGLCLKCHGSSDSVAIVNAIRQACNFIEAQVIEKMLNSLNNVGGN